MKYRIRETIFEDGHKEYKAQYAINCLFFNIWKDYICDIWDYGYGSIAFICCGHTYEDCKKHLLFTISRKEKERKATNIVGYENYKL